MANMTNVNIRMNTEMKKQAEELFEEIGINMTTAMTIFVKATLRERKIPFELKAPDDDGFYNDYNMKTLEAAVKSMKDGTAKYVTKTMEELEAMERE